MSHRPIIDAGPGLNFFSINKERLLIGTLGPLCAPETVRDELLRKSRQDSRFKNAERVWNKLPERYMKVLSDDVTPELAAAVHRITRLPMKERLRHSKDLGETMVIAHAVVAAEAGHEVIMLIDDGPGARVAKTEANRLRLLRAGGTPVGTLHLASTLTVLEKAAGGQYIPDRGTMRTIYGRLRDLDDGLPPHRGHQPLVRRPLALIQTSPGVRDPGRSSPGVPTGTAKADNPHHRLTRRK